jgi:hypothetical protein
MTTRRPNRLPTDAQLAGSYCQVCNGTGHTYLEHPDGTLSEEVCAYCHGRKNLTWWTEREMGYQSRIGGIKGMIWGYGALLVLTAHGSIWRHDYALKWVHFALFVVLLAGLVWVYVHPKPSKSTRRGPNPLTTDRERFMGTAAVGGALFKAKWDTSRRR